MKKKLHEILHKVVNDGFIVQLDDNYSLIATKNLDMFADPIFSAEPAVVYTPHFFMVSVESQEFTSIQVFNRDIIEALELTEHSKDKFNLEQTTFPNLSWKESTFDEFKSDFQMIKAKISGGEIEKALPITVESADWIPEIQHRLRMLSNIYKNSKNQRAYGYFSKTEGLIGLTPEVLFERKDKLIRTMALAGTQVKSTPAKNPTLLEDQKERREHQFVIEKIKSTLASFGEVTVGETQTLELPTLWHLYTEINCNRNIKNLCVETETETETETESANDSDKGLIEIMHPTPALGISSSLGLSWRWLQELANQSHRARFGAPFGFSTRTKSLVLVGIRNLQWNSNGSRIFSGCGIVAESQIEKEWNELRAKRQSVKAILGLE